MNSYIVTFELNGEIKSEFSEGATGDSAWQKILLKYLKDEYCRKISLINAQLEADNVE